MYANVKRFPVNYFLPAAFLFLFLTGCSSDNDDEAILCDPGPAVLSFEVVEETTGENLFESGRYTLEQVTIEDIQGEAVEFHAGSENVINVILGWATKSDTYSVNISEEIAFEIVFSLKRDVGENGCTATRIDKLELEGAEHETSNTTGITTIFVLAQEGSE